MTTIEDDGTAERVRSRLEERLVGELARLGRALSPADQRMLGQSLVGEALAEEAAARLRDGRELLSVEAEEALKTEVVAEVLGAAGLEKYLADPEVTDIDVNGPDVVHITYRDNRRLQVPPVVRSSEELEELIRLLARRAGVALDGSTVELDVSLPDGSRVTAVLGRVAPWPVLSVRLHHVSETDIADLVAWKMMPPELGQVVAALARAPRNLVISGGTRVGKTTLAAAWGHEIPADERIVTVEDTYELGLHLDGRHADVVPLLARRPNVEGAGAVSMVDLARLALRLNPSRVVIGEVRGAEASVMLDAMSQGNDGSACTVHASSAKQAFSRLAKYVTRAPERPRREDAIYDIADAVDVVIHLAWGLDGRRVISSVREVTGAVEAEIPASRELWAPGPDGMARRTALPLSPELANDLLRAGVDHAAIAPGDRR